MAQPTVQELAHAKMYRFMMTHLENNPAVQDMPLCEVKGIAREAAGMAKRMFENPEFWKDD